MLKEFRAFISRGNVIDLAVGVVIGAAFLGSFATAFVVQKAVLGAMFRAMQQSKQVRP